MVNRLRKVVGKMSKINYPTSVVSNESRYAYAYRLQELLRLEHNRKGKDFREGKISEKQWKEYKETQFTPKSDLIIEDILKYRAVLKKETSINARITDIVI